MKRFSVLGNWAVLGVALCLALASCSNSPNQSAEQAPGSDPAQSNLAPAGSTAPVEQTAAPAQQAPAQQTYAQQSQPAPANQYYDQNYAVGTDDTESGEQPVYTEQPPPSLPDYTQPECPGENYIWTPGYWAYASAGYYWVPGAWVLAPFVGALWTPPYWAYTDGRYRWYHGYWAPHVGFYGGVNYGFGYVGRGYEGGYWNRDVFDYNRVVNNVNVNTIHNVYSYRVTDFTNAKVSYDGGRGGLNVRPTASELAVFHEQRIAPVRAQVEHRQQAAGDRAQFDSVNHGRPQMFAAARPLTTEYRAPAARPTAVPGARVLPHANVRQEAAPTAQRPGERPAPNERPEARTNPMARTPEPRTEQRPVEQRPAQQRPAEQRPAEQRQLEQRPAPQARQESRPAPQPRMEQRPAPEAHQEARPVPQPHAEQRPAPQPRAEERSTPQRLAPQARPEARPTPQPRVEERPAPQAHGEAHPAPHPESKPAPKKEEKREEHPH